MLVLAMNPTILVVQAAAVGLFLSASIGCSAVKSQGPPASWKAVNGGMTRKEISSLIGAPRENPVQSSDTWVKAGWELRVEYDQYGRARNIFSQPAGR